MRSIRCLTERRPKLGDAMEACSMTITISQQFCTCSGSSFAGKRSNLMDGDLVGTQRSETLVKILLEALEGQTARGHSWITGRVTKFSDLLDYRGMTLKSDTDFAIIAFRDRVGELCREEVMTEDAVNGIQESSESLTTSWCKGSRRKDSVVETPWRGIVTECIPIRERLC